MADERRVDNFFPSNAKLPRHLVRQTPEVEDITPIPYIQDKESQNSFENNNHQHRHNNQRNNNSTNILDKLLDFDIDGLVKQNDKMLLLIIAFVLYKEKADWATIAAVIYLAL